MMLEQLVRDIHVTSAVPKVMEVCRWSSWLLTLLGVILLTEALQGVQGEVEIEGPSESECRPYIEKALKQLENVAAENLDEGQSNEETSIRDNESVDEEVTDEQRSKEHEDNKIEAQESKETEEVPEEVDVKSDETAEPSVEDGSEQTPEVQGSEEAPDSKSAEDVATETEAEASSTETPSAEATPESTSQETAETQSVEETKEEPSPEKSTEEASVETQESIQDEPSLETGETEQEPIIESIEEVPEISVEEKGEERSDETNDESIEKPLEESLEVTLEPSAEKTEEASLEEEAPTPSDQESEEAESDQQIVEEQLQASTTTSAESVETDANESTKEETVEAISDDNEKQEEKSTEEAQASSETEEIHERERRSAEDSTEDEAQQKIAGESVESTEEANENVTAESEEAVKSQESIETTTQDAEESMETQQEVPKESGSEEKQEDTEDSSMEGKSTEEAPEEELIIEMEIPKDLRPREHVEQLLKLDREATKTEEVIDRISEITLRELKRLYENAIKPLETLYKYRDLSNRHYGDAEIFSKPLILFMGPWSGGKSSIINYLLDIEYNDTSLRTGAEPSPAYFNLLMYGEEDEVLDGTQLAADYTFSGLQKFGQGLEERLRGLKLKNKLLEKVNIVEIPGILEVRKQVSRVFPFNDACQWFIDRADIIYLVYDPSKLDVGPETEAILDQLKGREYQTRIILNKADQVKPEELMRVQGALIWNISPLMSSPQPPVMYTTSLWSRPYEQWAPVRLLQAQERAFLRNLRSAIDRRIENKIASARRFAVRVRNHAKMVDCYLTTYYNHKSIFGNRKQVSDAIIEHPNEYHIYEGLSTLTNISRYDLPDPDVYKDFFRLNPLYEFQQLSATCTYFRGCPINKLDVAIAYDLPELVGKHKRLVDTALAESNVEQSQGS